MKHTRYLLFLLFLCIVSPSLVADEMSIAEALELGKSFGNENQADLESLSTHPNATTVPGYQGSNVPQTQYGNNPTAMQDEARREVNQSETGAFVTDSTANRPRFAFDRDTEPLLTRSNAIQDDPESVVGRITAEYSGCQRSIIATPPVYTEIIDCGSQTMCMDGGCFDTSYEPSRDFGQAAASLGAISEAGEDFNMETNEIFNGEDLRCSKTILDFSNCCKIDGWGQDIGLDQCATHEQRLALSRKAGLCHYVGSYCSNKTLFGCTSRKETHCCFQSKLARIIHEQGRIQLGINWGSAKNPNCDGLTVEQLQRLDFSQIEFSEFYADALGKANGPGGGELQGIIENYIEQSYQ